MPPSNTALSRHHGARPSRPAVRVVPTDFDFDLARRVGSILYGASAPTGDVADAHGVTVAATYGGGIVVTADHRDIERLASAVPAERVVTRPAR